MKMESAIRMVPHSEPMRTSCRLKFSKADQRTIEMKAARKGYLEMLSQFINMPLAEDTKLERPVLLSAETNEVKRPELQLFKFQQELLKLNTRPIKPGTCRGWDFLYRVATDDRALTY